MPRDRPKSIGIIIWTIQTFQRQKHKKVPLMPNRAFRHQLYFHVPVLQSLVDRNRRRRDRVKLRIQ